jgi:hypothetical protein
VERHQFLHEGTLFGLLLFAQTFFVALTTSVRYTILRAATSES